MQYGVHRLELKGDNVEKRLEQFLNTLDGEVVAIIPNYTKTTLATIYGIASKKFDYVLVVERIE